LIVQRVCGRATLIPIQITITKKHSDSIRTFFSTWKQWAANLPGCDIDIKFVWILQDVAGGVSFEEKEIPGWQTRQYADSAAQQVPMTTFLEYRISVWHLNASIGKYLSDARNATS
jgi:hypothetical protein